MAENLFILTVSLFLVAKGASLATKHAVRLAESFHLSKYLVGFIVIAIISILPEAFITINSAIEGIPAFGLGALFGSNVADLTLVFAIIIAVSGRDIKIQSKIIKNNIFFPFLLLVPIFLGFDGYYSRLEGSALIIVGLIFYLLAFKNGHNPSRSENGKKYRLKNFWFLALSMVLLLAGAHFTVTSATGLANNLQVNPVVIGMFIVGLGTIVPELMFSLKSIEKNHDSLAVGDIMGTVIADATIVVGILALISPFSFPQRIIYITGTFMALAAFLSFYFMSTDRKLSKKEGMGLLLFWLIFVLTELLING